MEQQKLFLKNCPLCNKSNFSNFYKYHHIIDIAYSYCNSCAIVFQNPTCSKQEWNNSYKYNYRKIYDNSTTPTESSLLLQKLRAEFYSYIIKFQQSRLQVSFGC